MSHDFTRRSFLSAATGAGALAFGIGSAGARQGPTYTLAMTQDGWVGQSPSEIQGQNAPTLNPDPGQEVTVEWENRTDIIHNFVVTRRYPGGNALFRSDYVAPGDSQTVTFTAEEGLAAYYCENHTEEKGDIVVGQGQQTATQTATVEERNLTTGGSVPFQTFRFVGSVPGWQALAPSGIQGKTNPTLRLVPGRTYAVIWINGDGAPHNWEIENEADETLVRSDVMERGGARQTVKFQATEEMSVYYCQYHPLRMRGEIEIVSEEEVTRQTTAPQQTAAGQQTTVEGQGDFTHQTVSRDIGAENATGTTAPGQTTVGGPTTVPAQETTTMPGQQDGAAEQTTTAAQQAAAGNGAVDTDQIVQTVRAPGFGALTALGGIGGAMSYLLSRDEGDEE
ncbi:cupredoxin domain-containing protein [Halorussus sp. AFM4]|uniref:cupredoxin domain-containing protein n=1 Tax=Halorussus sp. AFM4 TaxID=3421651 RepID=UPI003EB6C93C